MTDSESVLIENKWRKGIMKGSIQYWIDPTDGFMCGEEFALITLSENLKNPVILAEKESKAYTPILDHGHTMDDVYNKALELTSQIDAKLPKERIRRCRITARGLYQAYGFVGMLYLTWKLIRIIWM